MDGSLNLILEHLNSVVSLIAHMHKTILVHSHTNRVAKVTPLGSILAKRGHEHTTPLKYRHTMIFIFCDVQKVISSQANPHWSLEFAFA